MPLAQLLQKIESKVEWKVIVAGVLGDMAHRLGTVSINSEFLEFQTFCNSIWNIFLTFSGSWNEVSRVLSSTTPHN